MERTKRVLALLLCAVMLFGMILHQGLAVTAYAEEESDSGYEESPAAAPSQEEPKSLADQQKTPERQPEQPAEQQEEAEKQTEQSAQKTEALMWKQMLLGEDETCTHEKDTNGNCTVDPCDHGACCPKQPQESRYTIVYHSNDGEDKTTTYSPFVGDAITLNGADTFSRKGYTFQGWSDSPNGAVKYAGGKPVEGGLTQTVGSTVDLYAVWAKNPEHLHVDEDGDGFCDGEDHICMHVKDGNGNCTVGTCGHGSDCCPKQPEDPRYTIVYHSNDGEDKTSISTAAMAWPVTLKGAETFVREGYTCVGWTNGKTTYDCGQVVATGMTHDLTVDLYAVWAKNPEHVHVDEDGDGFCDGEDHICMHAKDGNGNCTVETCGHGSDCCPKQPEEPRYTIVYHSNDGKDKTSTYSPFVGDTLTLEGADTFVREGYTFQGWSDSPNGAVKYAGGKPVEGGLTQTVGSTVNLYAVWAKNPEHVHVDEDGDGFCDGEDHICMHVKDGNGNCTVGTCGHGSDCCPKQPEEPRYTIVYHSNDGKDKTSTYSPVVGDTLTLEGADTFVREGYTFQGWSDSPNGAVKYAGGKPVEGGLTQTVGSTVDLYAVWAKNPEHVHVDEDGDGFCDGEDHICMHVKDGNGNCTVGTCGHGSDCCPKQPQESRYTIVYHSNDGEDKTTTYSPFVGDAITLNGADTFVREGYTFQGWSDSPNGAVKYAGGKPVEGGLTQTVGSTVDLYAVWAKNPEHVHVDEDGDGFCDGEDHICMHAKDGNGNCTVETCGHGSDCCPKQPEEPRYTIVYHGNGGVLASDSGKDQATSTAIVGEEVTLKNAATFVREGYAFQGWSETADGAVQYAGSEKVATGLMSEAGSVDLYAVWSEVIYTCKVTLRHNDGTGKTEERTVSGKANTTVDLPVLPDRIGYHFDGWTMAGAVTYAGRSGMTQLTITADIPAELTLDAMWKQAEKQSYTVQYLNVADNSPIREAKAVNDATYLSVINSADEAIAIDHYKFDHASPDSLTVTTDPAQNVLKLYYVATVQVNFNLEGGHGIVASKTLIVGEPYGDLPHPPQIWKEGYTFAGWFLGREEITSSSIVELNVEHTLRAYWKKIDVCTVTFDSNGHGSYTKAEEVRYGSNCPEPEAPVDNEYAFTGWYTDPDCKHLYDFRCPVTHDLTLYAGWSESFTLTFVSNGGTEFGILRVPQNSVVDLRDYKPVRSGYSFCGWYTSRSGGDRNRVTYLKMDSDKTVYAMWKPVDSTNPKTGDSTNLGLAIGILVLSAVGLAAVIVIGKKKRDS